MKIGDLKRIFMQALYRYDKGEEIGSITDEDQSIIVNIQTTKGEQTRFIVEIREEKQVEIEKAQFDAVIKLFEDVIRQKDEIYIIPFLNMGYLTVQYINSDGSIEQAKLHRSLIELCEYLEREEEEQWMYHYSKEIKEEGIHYENLPESKKIELQEVRRRYREKIEEILS